MKPSKVFESGQVIAAEADKNYTVVILATGKRILISYTLKMVEAETGLLRVNRGVSVKASGFVIKGQYVHGYGLVYPVSRRRVKEVWKQISY